jgi:hypothetical protein
MTDTVQSSEPQATESSAREPRYIRYIGTAHIREMTREQWEGAGVNDQDSLYWHKGNGWTVPASKISDEAMTYVLADELMVPLYDEPEGDVLRTLPDNPNALVDRAPTGERLEGDGVSQVYEVPMAAYNPEPSQNATAGERPDAPSGATSGGSGGGGTGSVVGGSTGSSRPSTPSAGGPVGGSTANTGT